MASEHKGPVYAGGPAVDLVPNYIPKAITDEPPPVLPLMFHNPLATFTTRGCVNNCKFCAVPKIEGELRELDNWCPAPVVCDNNLLAARRAHFDRVIDRLKMFRYVDFNQGLEAGKFTPHVARRMAELQGVKVRFAFDHIGFEAKVHDAVKLAQEHGLKDIGCYVLIGFKDTPEDARYRLELLRSWGVIPNPMRYQPLNATEKNTYVGKEWTGQELRRMMRYYSRLNHLGWMPYEDYNPPVNTKGFGL